MLTQVVFNAKYCEEKSPDDVLTTLWSCKKEINYILVFSLENDFSHWLNPSSTFNYNFTIF